MQVDWETLQILSSTKSVDIALLFPTGPLNRMLARSGRIPAEWEARIDSHLGARNWRNDFYKPTLANTQTIFPGDLFSMPVQSVEKATNSEGLRQYVLGRLESIFAYVCTQQLAMKNTNGTVLYHLFIICANPSEAAKKLADRLASSAMDLSKRTGRR